MDRLESFSGGFLRRRDAVLSEQRVVQVFFSLAINLRLFITRNSKKRMSVAFTTFVFISNS